MCPDDLYIERRLFVDECLREARRLSALSRPGVGTAEGGDRLDILTARSWMLRDVAAVQLRVLERLEVQATLKPMAEPDPDPLAQPPAFASAQEAALASLPETLPEMEPEPDPEPEPFEFIPFTEAELTPDAALASAQEDAFASAQEDAFASAQEDADPPPPSEVSDVPFPTIPRSSPVDEQTSPDPEPPDLPPDLPRPRAAPVPSPDDGVHDLLLAARRPTSVTVTLSARSRPLPPYKGSFVGLGPDVAVVGLVPRVPDRPAPYDGIPDVLLVPRLVS